MNPRDHKPYDPSLGLSIQEMGKLTPGEFKRYKFVQRSHEEARKRRNQPNPPKPLDLGDVLAMSESDFQLEQLKRKGRLIQERESKRQKRDAKHAQQPPKDPNVLAPDELEKIRRQQKLNRFDQFAAEAKGHFAQWDREARHESV